MERKISEISYLVNSKIETNLLTNKNYISTENIIPNFGGISKARTIPSGKVKSFREGDVLLSNIRPYFKKIWYANIIGGCSNDVIILRNNDFVLSKYLYYSLNSDDFITNYVASCKGTKMPRGNIETLLSWKIEVPDLKEQQHIVNNRRTFNVY